MDFHTWLQKQPKDPQFQASKSSIDAVLGLAAEGATIPFMARYRKEKTGNLDEVGIEKIISLKEGWESTEKRREFVKKELLSSDLVKADQKDGLLAQLEQLADLSAIEDLYLPFKKKRKTKATVAKELGLEPLALMLWKECEAGGDQRPEDFANQFLNDTPIEGVDQEKALQGSSDIIIEKMTENLETKQKIRDHYFSGACLKSTQNSKAKKEASSNSGKFEKYFDYSEAVTKLLSAENSHRYLAMRRGWIEEELSLKFSGAPGNEDAFEAKNLSFLESLCGAQKNSACSDFLKKCARLCMKAYVAPSIEKEVHKKLKDIADAEAIGVFTNNVKKVLLAPPLGTKIVLGIDPGIRTGCKFAVVSEASKLITHGVFQLNTSQGKAQFLQTLPKLIEELKIEAIAVGNGTAGRETETEVRECLKQSDHSKLPVVMVNESGASIYSASEVARKEFPDLDLTVRGAISIARRLQDPLAELVKIDPKSIGVGQYQHDVAQPSLKKALELVVDTCVNQVGVELNTASEYLLARVSGIGPGIAKSILSYREKNGSFKSRADLKSVPRFSEKVFEQSAGFLRIKESTHPLDRTGVHPERYDDLKAFASESNIDITDILSEETSKKIKSSKTLKDKWGTFTHEDIVAELSKPGRDPRDNFEITSFRPDISEVSDLEVGMICPGVVTNVTNFGAFVDIGVHQDGLVHISQLSHNFVKDPHAVVSAGDPVKVKVMEVDVARKRVSLTMKLESTGQRPTHSSAGQRPSHSSNRTQRAKRPAPSRFENNPFAALKGLQGNKSD